MQPKEVPDTNPWMFHVWHTAHHVSTTENAKSSVDHPQNSGLEGLFLKKNKTTTTTTTTIAITTTITTTFFYAWLPGVSPWTSPWTSP